MSLLGHMQENERADMQLAHLRMICQGLLFRIVQQSRDSKNRGFVVVITSPTQGAGVSRITNALADALNKNGPQCAISLDCRNLDCDRYGFGDPIDINRWRSVDSLWQSEMPTAAGSNWHGIQESLAGALDKFRLKYPYVLIDCPSLRETQDAVRLAPMADGIILVVEANRTQKEQLAYAEKTIESAKGKILGYVLNKRTYVIPDWLSRKMEAIGL
jgi:Mrp family chromosome partitioning ATPase